MLARILKVMAVAVIFIFQTSFIAALPWPWFYFNFIIVTLVTLLVVADAGTVSWVVFLFGILSDIQAADFFGLNIISLLGALIVTHFALGKFFTNRSLYSFIFLTLAATVSYELIKAALRLSANFIGESVPLQFIITRHSFIDWGYEIAANIFSILIIFYLINYFSRRLKAFFIR